MMDDNFNVYERTCEILMYFGRLPDNVRTEEEEPDYSWGTRLFRYRMGWQGNFHPYTRPRDMWHDSVQVE